MTTRRKSRRQTVNVSLFPFLAVLLCTMGMLVMLLVLISQNTKSCQNSQVSEIATTIIATQKDLDQQNNQSVIVDAGENCVAAEELIDSEKKAASGNDAASEKKNIPEIEKEFEEIQERYGYAALEDIKTEYENAQWYFDELSNVQKRTSDALTTERDRLTATENGIKKRMDEISLLQQNIQSLLTQKEGNISDEQTLQKTILDRKAEITELQNEIQKKQQEVVNVQNSYAIIPYQGKNGTFRQPIFIECNENGVFLMPEKIPFQIEDFLLAKFPHNPFDTAIRTARQYMIEEQNRLNGQNQNTELNDSSTKQSSIDSSNVLTSNDSNVEPYPLLIIRPGGTDKYYPAVAALASWGGDYGYEFVDDDWNIEYPSPQPELEHRVKEMVALARYRLAIPLATLVAEMERSGKATNFPEKNAAESAPQNELLSQLGGNVKLASTSQDISNTQNVPNAQNNSNAQVTSNNQADPVLRNNPIAQNLVTPFATSTSGTHSKLLDKLAADRKLYYQPASKTAGLNENLGLINSDLSFSDESLNDKNQSSENNRLIGSQNNEINDVIEISDRIGLPLYQGEFASTRSENQANSGSSDINSMKNNSSITNNIASNNADLNNPNSNNIDIASQQDISNSNPLGKTLENVQENPTSRHLLTPYLKEDKTQTLITGSVTPEYLSNQSSFSESPVQDVQSQEILSQIQGRTITNNQSSDDLNHMITQEESWKMVGNTALAQNADGTVAEGSTTKSPYSSQTPSNGSGSDFSATQNMSTDSAASPVAMANVEKDQRTQTPDKKPAYASSENAKAINYSEEFRKPVESVIERPVKLECYADKIVFPKQNGLRKEEVIKLKGNLEQQKQELFQPIILCIKTWGVAGRNMSWSPWLNVKVHPGAENVFGQLKQIIEPQGIAVKTNNETSMNQ